MRDSKSVKVVSCRNCPLFSTEGMEHMMYCNHPYWRSKGAYSGAIITQDTVNSIPPKCPLRNGELHQITSISM